MSNFAFFKISVAFEWIQRQKDGRTRTVSSVIKFDFPSLSQLISKLAVT